MKKISSFIFILLIGCFFAPLFSQDTIFAPSIKEGNQIIVNEIFMSGCAHGHICCQAGCSCCTELKRNQQFDTIIYPIKNGTIRLKIVERYMYANSHELYPVHYRFKDENGRLSQKWYDVFSSRFYHYYDAINLQNVAKEEPRELLVVDSLSDFNFLDLEGKTLPMPFISNTKLSDSLYLSSIIVNNQRLFGLSDGKGTKKGPLNIREIRPTTKLGYTIFQNTLGKFGMMDQYGNSILACIYDDLNDLSNNRFEAKLKGLHGVINEKGTFLYVENFRQVSIFSEGLAFIQKDENKIAYIDLNGKELFEIKAKWGYEFHDGLAAVFKNDKWGYINTKGELILDYQYYQALHFENGTAPVAVSKENGPNQWRLINKQGEFVSSESYYEIKEFKNGLAKVFKNGQGYGMIDTKGKEIITCKYFIDEYGTQEDWYVFEGLILKETGSNKTSFIVNRNGEKTVDLSPYIAGRYVHDPKRNNDYLPFIHVYTEKGEQQLLDLNGKPVLKQAYKSVQLFNDSILVVREENRSGFVYNLSTKKTILSFDKNQDVYNTSFGLIQIRKSEENSYYDTYSYYDYDGNLLKVFPQVVE